MPCTTLTSISKGCVNNLGGVSAVYLWDMENQTTPVINTASWSITSLTAGATGLASYEQLRNTASYTEEATINVTNGSTFYTQTLNLVFPRREATKSLSIKIMGEGQRYLGALVKDANSNYWVLQDLQLMTVADGSGTAKTDGSKYTISLKAENEFLAYSIGATAAATLITTGHT